MLAYRVVCCSHQSDCLGYVSRTNQSVVFVLLFRFQRVDAGFGESVSKMESSFRMRNVGFSVLSTYIYRSL